MNSEDFIKCGSHVLKLITQYLENTKNFSVLPDIPPGYLQELIPATIPEQPIDWTTLLKDFETKILPGITHWQSPHFHAYYPTQTSYPAIIGEMLSAGLGVVGFNWICSPACTELELIVINWLAKFLKLPKKFLRSVGGTGGGGGVIHSSASEAILVAIIAARERSVKKFQGQTDIRDRLVLYTSDQSNSCVEKNCRIAALQIRLLAADENGRLTGEILEEAVLHDLRQGNVPCVCIATIGTTGTCAIDEIDSLAVICESYKIFLHVDAAYAGAALCLEEFNYLHNGLDRIDSFNFNLHKSMLVNFDCCATWFSNLNTVSEAMDVQRIYLQHQHETGHCSPDLRHLQIPLGRRFRALKVWLTLSIFGANGIREYLRNRYQLAEYFQDLLDKDRRFQVVHRALLGFLTFKVRGGEPNATRKLLDKVMKSRKLFFVPVIANGEFLIRFVIGGFNPQPTDINVTYKILTDSMEEIVSRKAIKG